MTNGNRDGCEYSLCVYPLCLCEVAPPHTCRNLMQQEWDEMSKGADIDAQSLQSSQHHEGSGTPQEPGVTAGETATMFDPTNHHNALKCPYCNPKGLAFEKPLDRETLNALTIQNIQYHDHIRDLEEALQIIARKKKMDATAAVSMRAIAISVLSPAAPEIDDPGRPVPKHGSGP